jgi:crossover junction endodeoxyribonuclease RuvC
VTEAAAGRGAGAAGALTPAQRAWLAAERAATVSGAARRLKE